MFFKNTSKTENFDLPMPDYDGFEDVLMKENPSLTSQELSFYEKSRNKIIYYKNDLMEKYNVKDRDIVGYTYLRRRKVYKHTKNGELVNIKNKSINVYEFLEGSRLGFIPTENNGCIIVNLRRISLFDVFLPVAIVRIIIYMIFRV